MSPHIYAGATLALAGLIDQQQRLIVPRYLNTPTHPFGILGCRTCRAVIRSQLYRWLHQQSLAAARTTAPSDPYEMAA